MYMFFILTKPLFTAKENKAQQKQKTHLQTLYRKNVLALDLNRYEQLDA